MAKRKETEDTEIVVEANVDGKKVISKTYAVAVEAVDFREESKQEKLTPDYLRRIYDQDDIVGPIVDAEVFSCTTAGYHFESYKGTEVNQRHLEIVSRFFDEPNEEDTANDLLRDCFMDMLVYGTAYWEIATIVKNMVDYEKNLHDEKVKPEDIDFPYRLYRMNPEYIKIRMNQEGKITSFAQKIKGIERARFKPDQVVHFKLPNPGSSAYGLAPAAKTGISSAIAANMYCSDYNGKFFRNNATPRLHIDLGNVTEPDLKKFTAYLETNIKGQPHKNLITASKDPNHRVVINPISLKNSEMEFSVYERRLRQKVFGAYRMQPIIMGITENESKTTVDAQISIYKAQAIKPIQKIGEDRINRKIMKRMFPRVKLIFKFNPVDILDELQQMNIKVLELQNQIKTVNEIRKEQGLAPVSWGNTPIIPFSRAEIAQLPAKPPKKEDAEVKEEEKIDGKEE